MRLYLWIRSLCGRKPTVVEAADQRWVEASEDTTLSPTWTPGARSAITVILTDRNHEV